MKVEVMQDAIHAVKYALKQKESILRSIENWAEGSNHDVRFLPEHKQTVEEIAAFRRALGALEKMDKSLEYFWLAFGVLMIILVW